MKLDYLKDKKELAWVSHFATSGKMRSLSIVLLGVSAFLGVLVLVKVAGFFVAPARAENTVQRAVAQSKLDANDMKKYFAESKAIADELKKKNLFAPPPPKQHPVKQVLGILGDEALIGDKWYKVGGKVADAEIVAIEPTHARIKWDGKEKVFAPISATSAPEPKKDVKKQPVEKQMKAAKIKTVQKTVKEKVAAAPVEEDPLAWMGVNLPPKLREKLLEHWNKASDEQKAKAKEQWNSMPDEQKQQAVEAMQMGN